MDPAQNEQWPNQLLLLAAVYRSIYGVIASYVIAWLGPNRPMGHSLVAGGLGLLVSALVGRSCCMEQHCRPALVCHCALAHGDPYDVDRRKLRLMQFWTGIAAA